MNLNIFNTANLFDAATNLFQQLGIKLNSNTAEPLPVKDLLKEHYKDNDMFNAIDQSFFIGIIDDTVFKDTGMFDINYSYNEAIEQGDKNYKGLMLFALALNKQPTRTEIAVLTRAFNRISQKMPVALVLKYTIDEEAVISIAISERFKYLQNWRQGEKVGKVIILRDIHTQNTHAGHTRILLDLVKPAAVTNYDQLHQHWMQVLDLSILNKKFFQDLANWYFWAMDNVQFPDDLEKRTDIRNATNLIRLITRVIFIWFIKEKSLVNNDLFKQEYIKKILKDFNENTKSKNYYNAILQNLFFGTLNQKTEERKFAKEGDIQTNQNEYGVKNLFRYADLFNISEIEVLALFKDIPFLNGGLFDCLDKPDEYGKILYVDGFSRNPKKQAIVPDFLFFDKEKEVDLNEIYGTRNKTYKSRGLINLLESYKFTVAENTPLEEEIALDPELLGKVFENLLASYNPETQNTARKQTGSFYTPREIVDYMADESLLEYIKQNVKNDSKDFETRLRDVLSYSENPNPFNETETKALIEAINNCKILDPACGSGAFPMGILHKMVHILKKLDPENKHWKDLQRQKAMEETEAAFQIGNKEERLQRLAEINDVFENNASDYGRKLYLIENCIYGIDIQPIAVQISKLRFFISLVIDQKVNKDKENFGIRSLPNLETKFVAANTLIALDKPQQTLLRNLEIEAKENQLKELRHKYFTANTRKEKIILQKQDKKLRQEIAKMLENDGWGTTVAQQIVAFDPYDQNHFADWFDPEWMFGVKDGFDIVIGNPPYGANMKKMEKEILDKKFNHLKSTTKNSVIYFIYVSHLFLKSKGINSFIIPKSFCFSNGWNQCVKFLLPYLVKLIDVGKAFENVKLEQIIFISTLNCKNDTYINGLYENEGIKEFKPVPKMIFDNYKILLSGQTEEEISIILSLLNKLPKRWGDYVKIERGLNWQNISHKNMGETPIYRGSQLNKYYLSDPTDFIDLSKFKPEEYKYQFNPKILNQLAIAHIKNPYPHFLVQSVLDMENRLVYETISCSFAKNEKISLKLLLAINNSKIFEWLLYKFVFSNAIRSTRYDEIYVSKIPCPDLELVNEKPIVYLVDQILNAKKQDPNTDTSALEREIDHLVYQLYGLTEEEIKIIEEK